MPTSSYTNEFLHTHTRTSFYANQLFHQPVFTETTFCTNQILQTSFYTNQFVHQPALKFIQTNQFLDKSPFAQPTFYNNLLLQQPDFTSQLLHPPLFRQTNLFTPTSFTHDLWLHWYSFSESQYPGMWSNPGGPKTQMDVPRVC